MVFSYLLQRRPDEEETRCLRSSPASLSEAKSFHCVTEAREVVERRRGKTGRLTGSNRSLKSVLNNVHVHFPCATSQKLLFWTSCSTCTEGHYQSVETKTGIKHNIKFLFACSPLLALLTPRPALAVCLSWWKITAKLGIWIANFHDNEWTRHSSLS